MNSSTFLGLTTQAWAHIGRHLLWSGLAALVSFIASQIIPFIQVPAGAAFAIPLITTALVSVKTFFTDQSQY